LKTEDLIRLHFSKNEEGEPVDPVTYKVFTDNTHIVALKNTGNVFAYDTVERLNVKARMWRDLVSDDEFTRKDIITLQDPQNVQSRNLSSFKYLQEGINPHTDDQQKKRSLGVTSSALGNAALVLAPKELSPTPTKSQVGKYLYQAPPITPSTDTSNAATSKSTPKSAHTSKTTPYNAAQHTTGQAAASFTSTGLTPHTSGDLALLSDEEYMLKPRRVKTSGYARITTTHGPLNLELLPECAPKAVWNFIQLAKKGYYKDVIFHRNIRNFMLQGGDPTGTGRGGTSCWGKNFEDEFDGPLSHDVRGMVSMANKGKGTNSSQFFITYRACKHLDRKHTIFGRVVGGVETLKVIENVDVDEGKRPLEEVKMEEVLIFVDPFEEFLKSKAQMDEKEKVEEAIRKAGGREDDRTTWTGKRLRLDGGEGENGAMSGVGKYLSPSNGDEAGAGEVMEEWEREGPVKKKVKGGGGFGNFDSW